MSRPNTRNKNKRHQRTEDSENSTSDILRKIHTTGEITKDDIHQLYSVYKPVCHTCRTNSKENPNCFCALIPPPNGTRKSGLWQKTQDLILSLGPNPCKDFRSSTDTPAGLTNLGATCYANSILQCLYMNIPFRAGIFSLEPAVLGQYPVLGQLVRLFAQLHSSKMGFIDSAPFIKTLELDNGVQQDSHEFLTLFLSLLERSLRHSRVSSAKTVVQDLFRGSVSHVTRCSRCGKDSEASSKMEDFYELELNIKDLKTLGESLDEYLSMEQLEGDNQYFCESCCTRVDATRSIKLRFLPPILNLQLKRYVFLPKTTTKKKITSAFSFPRQLDMGNRLTLTLTNPPSPSASPFTYELSAILIHKGATVNSGHYVAHIKDELTGQWWEFDDEHVSKLGSHPFGESTNNNNNNNNNTKNSKNNNNINTVSNGNVLEENGCGAGEVFSSTDAYMLMYRRRGVGGGGENTGGENNGGGLPSHLYEEVKKLNDEYTESCEQYQRLKDEKLAYVTERRKEVKSVLAETTVEPDEELYYWVSAEWVRQWADSITPPVLDNSPIQCEHGKVPVSKASSMKRVSSTAWLMLQSKYGGGPALSSEDYCTECLKSGARSAVSADVYRDRKASLRQLAEAALAGKCSDDGPSYFVSRAWLVQWLRRKKSDADCSPDAGPTSSLTCPHGGLLPEGSSGAKRVSVPENLWLFLYETHTNKMNNNNSDNNNDINGSNDNNDDNNDNNDKEDLMIEDLPTYPSNTLPCEICSQELSEVACVEDFLRATKLKQKQNHEKLISGKSFALIPGEKYYLVPSSWLAKWRAYVSATGKYVSSLPEPGNLQATIDSLICEKHSKLLERPLELVCKRGAITQKSSTSDGLALIPEANWVLFSDEWNVPEGKGILAEISLISTSQDNNYNNIIINNNNDNCKKDQLAVGSYKDAAISVEDTGPTSDDMDEDLEARKPNIKTNPEVCEICIGERESCALMQRLNYTDQNISVYLVRGKEVPKSIREAVSVSTSASVSDPPERRTSKRSRKSAYGGNSVSLKVSGCTTVYRLKMMIWEAFGVVKENQKLHKGTVEIEGDSDTLADKNIFPGDLLWVKDSEIHENRDIADELSEEKNEAKKGEEGFRGTLLTSDIEQIYGDTFLH